MATVSDVAYAFLQIDEQNDECDGLSNLKLQKLVYYAQGFYLAIKDTPLFEEEIEAWAHGPVVPELYHEYKEYGKNSIDIEKGEIKNISSDEYDLIDEVYGVFGQYSAWKLRNLTHEETPWINHEAKAEVIPKEELNEYFKTRIN